MVLYQIEVHQFPKSRHHPKYIHLLISQSIITYNILPHNYTHVFLHFYVFVYLCLFFSKSKLIYNYYGIFFCSFFLVLYCKNLKMKKKDFMGF